MASLAGDASFTSAGDLASTRMRLGGTTCSVDVGDQQVLTATVADFRGRADAARLRATIRGERRGLSRSCPRGTLFADPGLGWACPHDGDVGLAVVTDRRLIRLVAHSTPAHDATVAVAKALAQEIDERADAS